MKRTDSLDSRTSELKRRLGTAKRNNTIRRRRPTVPHYASLSLSSRFWRGHNSCHDGVEERGDAASGFRLLAVDDPSRLCCGTPRVVAARRSSLHPLAPGKPQKAADPSTPRSRGSSGQHKGGELEKWAPGKAAFLQPTLAGATCNAATRRIHAEALALF